MRFTPPSLALTAVALLVGGGTALALLVQLRSHGGAYPWEQLDVGGISSSSSPALPQVPSEGAADHGRIPHSGLRTGEDSREWLEKVLREGIAVHGRRLQVGTLPRVYRQTFPRPERQTLGLALRTDHTKLPPEGGPVVLEVGVQAADRAVVPRSPRDVVLVIDQSNTMAALGKTGAVPAAVRTVIDGLDQHDRLAIVTFSDSAAVRYRLAPVGEPEALEATLDGGYGEGTGGLYAALEAAYGELARVGRSDADALVLLVAGGELRQGGHDPGAFEALVSRASDQRIETAAIGLGLSFDEELLMIIAGAGGGDYHFLWDPAKLKEAIDAELAGLAALAARAVRIRLELSDDVRLVRVLGTEQLSTVEGDGVRLEERRLDQDIFEELGMRSDRVVEDEPGVKIQMPAFGAGEAHVVLLELSVPPGRGERALGRVYLKYRDASDGRTRRLEAPARIRFAREAAGARGSIEPSVRKNLLGLQTGEALMNASRLVEAGRIEDAERQLDEQLAAMVAAGRRWKDRDLEQDAALLGQYRDTIIAFDAHGWTRELASYLGKSFSYAAYQRLK